METFIACHTCGLVQRVEELSPGLIVECYRCGSSLATHTVNSIGRTAAFSLAALTFYVPANIYPILHMQLYGAHSESAIWDGCATLFQKGQYFVAAIVFLASILFPLLKLVGLFYLDATTKLRSRRRGDADRNAPGSTKPST
jgi:paraquat-inducible protein A